MSFFLKDCVCQVTFAFKHPQLTEIVMGNICSQTGSKKHRENTCYFEKETKKNNIIYMVKSHVMDSLLKFIFSNPNWLF